MRISASVFIFLAFATSSFADGYIILTPFNEEGKGYIERLPEGMWIITFIREGVPIKYQPIENVNINIQNSSVSYSYFGLEYTSTIEDEYTECYFFNNGDTSMYDE